MKFGINTFLWTAHFGPDHFGLLPVIRQHGFDGIEVTLVRPSEFEARKIRSAIQENGLACTVCSVLPRELSVISEDSATRQRTRTHLEECVRQTAEAGAQILAGPLYAPVGFFTGSRRTAEQWSRAVEAYQQLAPTLKEHGVTLCVEPLNRFETFFLNTTADALKLCEQVNAPAEVGILWDSFHANIEEKNLAIALQSTGSYLKHVHTCENDRGIPGSGHIDWNNLFSVLGSLSYQGWLTIESFGFALGDLSAAASIWRNLAAEPEEIAWNGLAFLKRAHNRISKV